MAVTCPACGRGYDVTLFAFGRTISCACGSRVGRAPPERPLPVDAPPRFAADAMLGRVARWLRLLGFDCSYEPGVADADLVRCATEQERVILTRDRRLPAEWWVPHVAVLRADSLPDQLVEVLRRFELPEFVRPLSRCSRCNRRLERVARDVAAGQVPRRVWAEERAFSRCPDCRRIYWEGSHADRIRRVVAALTSRSGAASPSLESPPSASRSP